MPVSKENVLADMGRKEDQELEELSLETLVSDERNPAQNPMFSRRNSTIS